jgi:hypothetical protein
LRSEHGVAFEKVGVVDNDMTSGFQTFIIPMTHTDFHNPKYNLKTIWLNKTSQLPSEIDTGDDKLNVIMMDYRSRIVDLMQICEDMQGDVNTLLAPYDVEEELLGNGEIKSAENGETQAENLITPLPLVQDCDTTNITDELDRPNLDRPDIKNRTKRAWFPFMVGS